MKLKYRYQYAPQMRDYDRIGQTWLPYIMYFHEPQYRSNAVNTDSRGFRLVTDANSEPVRDFDNALGLPVSLLVGGSAAFGVGASNDAYSMPSLLNRRSDSIWFNLGGRAYGSTQEQILFLLHTPLFDGVRDIVIMSGVNNLYHYYTSREYPKEIGSFYFSNQYRRRMGNAILSNNRKRLKFLLEPFFGDRLDYSGSWQEILGAITGGARSSPAAHPQGIYEAITDHDEQKEDLLYALRRDIANWQLLSQAHDFKVTYVLQPLASWVDKAYSAEEEILFAELDEHQAGSDYLREKLNYDQYLWFAGNLKRICGDCGMRFLDMNEELANRPLDDRWLFVDRIHLTDSGYQLLADILAAKI